MQRFATALGKLEEGLLAALLAAMTLITFSQVVARYVFNSGATWALQLTTILFAWMILLGMSYGIRTSAHLGVDALVTALPSRWRRICALIAAFACLAYALAMLEAGWLTLFFGDDINARGGAFHYVNKIREIGVELEDMPAPRWLAYLALPIGLLMFAARTIVAIYEIATGRRSGVIAAHEATELIEAHQAPAQSSNETRN